MAYAWTGQKDPEFRVTFWLVCLALVFRALSMLSFVLYRTSGRALLDNIVQVLRTVCLIAVVAASRKLGFQGLLAGMVLTEFVGMTVMLFGLTRTFDLFKAKSLLPDAVRLFTAAILIFGSGALASHIPLLQQWGGRVDATIKLVEICIGCLLVGWPSLAFTGSVTREESRALFSAFIPAQANPIPVLAQNVLE